MDCSTGIQRASETHGQGRNATYRRIRNHYEPCVPFEFHQAERQVHLWRRAGVIHRTHAWRLDDISRRRYHCIWGHETDRGVVQTSSGVFANRRSLHHGTPRGRVCHSLAGCEARYTDALWNFSATDGHPGSATRGMRRHCGVTDPRAEAGRKPVKLPKNLRSGFMQEDVEDYLYELLPNRDQVISDMEKYAAKQNVPIIGPAVARMLALLVQISGAKRIFELGSAIGYSTIWLARAAGPQAEITYTDSD